MSNRQGMADFLDILLFRSIPFRSNRQGMADFEISSSFGRFSLSMTVNQWIVIACFGISRFCRPKVDDWVFSSATSMLTRIRIAQANTHARNDTRQNFRDEIPK